MSRAFVNEDAGSGRAAGRGRRYALPPREDPGFDEAAALALLNASLDGDTESAEAATGYYWGAERLRAAVERILARARAEDDESLARAAERFLR